MSPLVVGLVVPVAIVALRLFGIIRRFRANPATEARRALWTVIPFTISFVTAFIMIHLPPLPVVELGTGRVAPHRFADCAASRRRLPIIRGELRDSHLQPASLGGPAWVNPVLSGGIGRIDEHVQMYVYHGPTTQHSVQAIFVSIDHIARTSAFGTTDHNHRFDVGDPHYLYLNDSAQCVRDRLGLPSMQFSNGVVYNLGDKVGRFYGFGADGDVEWIGYAYGKPVTTRLRTAELMEPVGLGAFIVCLLCLLTMFAGRPVALMLRALVRRMMFKVSAYLRTRR